MGTNLSVDSKLYIWFVVVLETNSRVYKTKIYVVFGDMVEKGIL